MIFVFRFYIQRPTISIDQQEYIVTNNKVVTISGETKNVHTLYINSVPVLLDESGKFSQKRGVTPGVSIIFIQGKDTFDRLTEKKVSIERQEEFTPPEIEEETEDEIEDNLDEIEKLTN